MFKNTLQPFLLLLLLSVVASGQVFDEEFDHWPVQLKIRGTVLVSHDLELDPDTAQRLFSSRQVINAVGLILGGDEGVAKQIDAAMTAVANCKYKRIASDADDATIAKSLDEVQLAFVIADVKDAVTLERIEKLRKSLTALVDRGGIVFAQGPWVTRLGVYDLTGKQGWNLIPDAIIERASHSDPTTIKSALVKSPTCVGLRIDRGAVLALRGRLIQALGEGAVTAIVTANDRDPFLVKRLVQRTAVRQNRQEYMIDITQWRRIALDRTLPVFPPKEPKKPFVENGTLVIVGGGGMPRGLMGRIVQMAGGKDKAKMVYVPCSESDQLNPRQRTVEGWKRTGVANASFIHTKDRNKANKDDAILGPLKDATGLWFGGGRQWNFADSYYGTEAHKLMKEVLRRGGVIGGSSAGASIQGRYLARATPINNFDIMAPGYERGGLGFLSGVAIDQHFSQRRRQANMTELVDKYPQLLGIGIDEATAIIVQKSVAEVVGRGKVFFYDRRMPVYPDKPDYIALPAGSKYDLVERKVLIDATKTNDEKKEAKDKPVEKKAVTKTNNEG